MLNEKIIRSIVKMYDDNAVLDNILQIKWDKFMDGSIYASVIVQEKTEKVSYDILIEISNQFITMRIDGSKNYHIETTIFLGKHYTPNITMEHDLSEACRPIINSYFTYDPYHENMHPKYIEDISQAFDIKISPVSYRSKNLIIYFAKIHKADKSFKPKLDISGDIVLYHFKNPEETIGSMSCIITGLTHDKYIHYDSNYNAIVRMIHFYDPN